MRTGRTLAVAVALVVLTAAPLVAHRAQRAAARNDDADVLLQAAMHKEQVEGRLPEAIEAYKAVVTKAGPNKSVAAKALLQLAGSYEKLGRPEARATYQTIVRNYPDQPAVVAAARARLAAGGVRGQLDVSPRRVLDGAWSSMFDISPDGRLTVGPERTGYSSYNIVLRDVLTGRASILVPGANGRFGFQARISNDGRRVAYNWFELETSSLRVVGIDAGSTPEVITVPQTSMVPMDWSPDDKAVLVMIPRFGNATMPQEETSRELAWVSVESKSVRTIKTFESWQKPIFDARVSPDGRFVAFSALPRAGSTDRYLYLIDASGQREMAVVATAGSRQSPVWTPDGAHLIFVGTSAGRSALWSIGIRDGQATGDPFVVQSDFSGAPIGMTTSGSFYYTRNDGGDNYEYVVNRRPAQGERVVTFVGLSASWSRDGRAVAFVRGTNGSDLDLIVRDLDTGQERSYQHAGISVVSPRWLSDGSGVIVVVNERLNGQEVPSFQLVDLRTGTFRHLFDRDASGHGRTGVGTLSPDGKTLYLGVRDNAGSVTGIVGVDLGTGEERPVARFTPGTGQAASFGLAVSPDGTTLAVTAWTKAYAAARIFTVAADGSNYREVFGPFETGWLGDTIRWTPDGRALVFVVFDANRNWRVMRVPAEGGRAESDGLDFDTLAPLLPGLRMFPGNFNNIDLSPDGSRIIASTLTSAKIELWTLENLLSVISSQ